MIVVWGCTTNVPLTPTKDTKPMATERQIAANLANSTRSTGPKTIEGKDKSRFNAALLLNLDLMPNP
jgi:hypothetical protein